MIKSFFATLLFVAGLFGIAGALAPEEAKAQTPAACQWNYAIINGVSTATYCGAIGYNGSAVSTITVSQQPQYTFPEANSTCAQEFAGDFSKTFAPHCYQVNAGVLGQPATSYQWSPAVTPNDDQIQMYGGWNQSTSGNSGRTGWADTFVNINHFGQGDAGMMRFFGQIQAPMLPGETNFTAGKAIFGFAGNWGASVAGGYEQGIGDFDFSDGGFETAVIAYTANYYRTVNTTTYGSVWIGDYQSALSSTKAIDAGRDLLGPFVVGEDFTLGTYSSAAIALPTGSKITFNQTSSPIGGINWYGNVTGGSYIQDVSGVLNIQGQGGSTGSVNMPGTLTIGGTLAINGGFPPNIAFLKNSVNFNSANSDNAIAIALPSSYPRFMINAIRISAASTSLTTATAGVFTGAGGTGVAIASTQAITVSTSADATVNNAQNMTIAVSTTSQTFYGVNYPNLYFRITTPEGVAATANVEVVIALLP